MDQENKPENSYDFCRNCKTKDWDALVKFVHCDQPRYFYALCRDCRSGNKPGIPDVYFNPKDGAVQYEENIWDKKTNQPIPFYDKTSKAAAMKQAGVREAGDAHHGTRNFRH